MDISAALWAVRLGNDFTFFYVPLLCVCTLPGKAVFVLGGMLNPTYSVTHSLVINRKVLL